MSFEPNATQAQTLLRLLFIAEEPAMSKLKPSLPAAKRKELVSAGLIAVEKRGRAQYVTLTDQGWAWAGANLDTLCPKNLNQLNREILEAMLKAIRQNMALRGLSLAELVRPEMFAGEPETEALPVPMPPPTPESGTLSEPLPHVIRRVCMRLTEERPGSRIRLVDLRQELPQVDRSVLDATLLQMQLDNEIVLITLEHFEVGSNDEAALIRVAGAPRHAVYLKQR